MLLGSLTPMFHMAGRPGNSLIPSSNDSLKNMSDSVRLEKTSSCAGMSLSEAQLVHCPPYQALEMLLDLRAQSSDRNPAWDGSAIVIEGGHCF